ncbi:MAG TPA: TOBE-like domain-containing protein [Terriglobia bacterium]|nr:TOBE-like domain-containing protein [Terriglobia bacterium]
MMELVHLPDAAKELGVSYPTLKQWIYRRKIRSVKTAGGHHRIPRAEIDRVLFQKASRGRGYLKRAATPDAVRTVAQHEASGSGLGHIISGRNQLVGRVTAIQTVGLLAKVTLDIGGQRVTAIITRDACEELKLKVGETAAALIKATEVMIIRPS